jgi:hypothetical protein
LIPLKVKNPQERAEDESDGGRTISDNLHWLNYYAFHGLSQKTNSEHHARIAVGRSRVFCHKHLPDYFFMLAQSHTFKEHLLRDASAPQDRELKELH